MLKQKERQILNKFYKNFDFVVTPTDKNPVMKNEQMNHFKVFIKNKETGKEKSFIYSVGLGITDTETESILWGLIGCFYMDLSYIDLDEFDGLGYQGKEAVKVYEAICTQHENLKEIGLLSELESLSEKEQELLN